MKTIFPKALESFLSKYTVFIPQKGKRLTKSGVEFFDKILKEFGLKTTEL